MGRFSFIRLCRQSKNKHEETGNKSQKFRHTPPDGIGFAYLYVGRRHLVTENFRGALLVWLKARNPTTTIMKNDRGPPPH
jgi:hypothetical protein